MNTKRKAAAFAALAFSALAAGCAAALIFGQFEVPLVAAGYVTYVAFGRKAMILWRIDEAAFDHSRGPRTGTRGGRTARLVAATLFLSALALPLSAQQTIFNIPSADVLDKGKFYLEADALGRWDDPEFGLFTARGVYGFGSNIEAGVNFGGFAATGRSVPYATPNIKWQFWHNDRLALQAGAFGLFYLRGSRDGDPAALGYVEAAWKLPTNTRLTAGGYWASSGYAAPDPQAGALLGLEQKVFDHLNVIADWISGENGIGYFTPGVSVPLDAWTIYLGYSLKNGDSKGNALLVEVGVHFLRRLACWT